MRAGKAAVAKVLGENAPSIGPGDALAVAQRLPADSIVFFLNPQRVWEQADIVQGIWNLRDVFKAGGQMLVLVTPPGTRLPVEVQNDVMVIDEPLPSAEDLERLVSKHSSRPICRYRMSASSRKPLTQLLVWRRFQRSRPWQCRSQKAASISTGFGSGSAKPSSRPLGSQSGVEGRASIRSADAKASNGFSPRFFRARKRHA